MNFEKEKILIYYKRLISLYPQSFRTRFGESMEQAFNDVCNEQKEKLSLTFVVSTFAETSVGILKENLHEGVFMNKISLRIIFSIAFGLLATAPFFILQWIYSNGYPIGIPWSVFNFLFVVATLFCLLVLSISRTAFKNPFKVWILPFSLKILAAIPLVLSWATMISDQMPCFLGGRGC